MRIFRVKLMATSKKKIEKKQIKRGATNRFLSVLNKDLQSYKNKNNVNKYK